MEIGDGETCEDVMGLSRESKGLRDFGGNENQLEIVQYLYQGFELICGSWSVISAGPFLVLVL